MWKMSIPCAIIVIMTTSEIYLKYNINKGLQEHMIRVASVAELICTHATTPLDTKNIVTACLLHDLGNLIKAKMDSMPELYEPEGVAYWSVVQSDMKATYGDDEHEATIAMVREINPGEQATFYFNAIGSEAMTRVYENGTLGEKIATYCDMRVGPFGIISLKDRMDDLRARYLIRQKPGFAAADIDERERRLQEVEAEIFAKNTLSPTDITDEKTKTIQTALLTRSIN
jgi:HD domain